MKDRGRWRIVLDCNTVVQAMTHPLGVGRRCVDAFLAARVEHFISRSTLRELRRVLRYPEVIALSRDMTEERIADFLKIFQYRSTFVRRVPHLMDYPRDPDDEPYLDLAAAVQAKFLISSDNDLLSLMSGHSPLAKRFRQNTRPLEIIRPLDFIQRLKEDAS